jgi:hypothetical protein
MAAASAAACTTPAQGQARPFSGSDVQTIYQRLLGQINQIPVFDNHGHPAFPDDSDVDAMTISPDSALPFRLRENNPEMAGAANPFSPSQIPGRPSVPSLHWPSPPSVGLREDS